MGQVPLFSVNYTVTLINPSFGFTKAFCNKSNQIINKTQLLSIKPLVKAMRVVVNKF